MSRRTSFFQPFLKGAVNAFFAFLLSGFLLFSCSPDKGKKLARVGSAVLYETDLAQRLSDSKDTLLREIMVRNWILEQLVYRKAKRELTRKELDKSKEMQDYYRQLLRYEYEKKFIENLKGPIVTDSEVQKEYAENHWNDGISSNDSVKNAIREILVNRKQNLLVKQLESRLWQEALDKKEVEIY